ncbi:MAG: hypothetical protein LBL24_00275 [Bacteroidales bacterium]|nr:hypothetical protein [Bacteroidales bacterium]
MAKVKRHKILVIWLLSVVFILPFAVTTVHIYHIYHTAEHLEHSCSDSHDCSDCPICRFILSFFTETAVVDAGFKVISFSFKPVIFFQNKPFRQLLISYGLRAPPLA